MERLNIVIGAHELSPEQSSECSVGWNIVIRLGNYHNITVLYAESNQSNTSNYKKAVDNYLKNNGLIQGVEFIEIKQPLITRLISRINKIITGYKDGQGLRILYYIGYKLWQLKAYSVAKKLHREKKFQLAHHLTVIGFREPGYLWRLPVPFIWGPVGGVTNISFRFQKSRGMSELFSEIIRYIITKLQLYLQPNVRQAGKRAKKIFAATQSDLVILNKRFKKKAELIPVAACDQNAVKKQNLINDIVNVLWCGRMVRWKALDLLLRAIGSDEILKQKIKLTVVGDGPLLNEWTELAKNLNIEKITWKGQVSYFELQKLMNNSDLFAHTSFQEVIAIVVLDAMSVGLPVICNNVYGMSTIINDTCGIRIPMITYEESIKGFQKALTNVVNNKDIIEKMSNNIFLRAKELSWDSIAFQINQSYISIR